MAKRIADKELTDRNWDQEEDTEEVMTRKYSEGLEAAERHFCQKLASYLKGMQKLSSHCYIPS